MVRRCGCCDAERSVDITILRLIYGLCMYSWMEEAEYVDEDDEFYEQTGRDTCGFVLFYISLLALI